MFCCEVIVTVFDWRVGNRPLSLYVYYKREWSLLLFKRNGTAKARFSFFVFCRGQQNLLRVWSHGADHQGKKKQFLFSLVQFLLLVFSKRKHLEIGPTEFGNLWISAQFFYSQCESFDDLKFKCNNTIGNPAMGTSDLPCHRTGPFAVLLVLTSVPRETQLLVVSLLHQTRHQGHAKVFPAWMAALLKVYKIHEREDECDHSRDTWFISHLSYHPANEPKEHNMSARLHANVHQ